VEEGGVRDVRGEGEEQEKTDVRELEWKWELRGR